MRRISRELQVAVGTIYNYYGSKDDLLIELFEVSWKKTIDRINAVTESYKPDELAVINQLEAIFAIIMEDVKRRNGLGKKIYFARNREDKEGKGAKVYNLRSGIEACFKKILRHTALSEEGIDNLSKWMFLILFDSIANGHSIKTSEIEMLEVLLGD